MKILQVIHGYPPRYSAGSEVYTQTLCHALAKRGHNIVVFTRQEDAYIQEYSVIPELDHKNPSIKLWIINMVHSQSSYKHEIVDQAFEKIVNDWKPEVIHIGHLNHLSTGLVEVAHNKKIPIVFTLHDFWMMCPRGQFLQTINSKGDDLYPVCDGQEDHKCAITCYWRYFGSQTDNEDIAHWTRWVNKRMSHVKKISSYVDIFISPSKYLMNLFSKDFLPYLNPKPEVWYLDYGFDLQRLKGRKRQKKEAFVFGYIGTHKQAKGIHHLIEAFSKIDAEATLKIWGSSLSLFTDSLKRFILNLPFHIQQRIEWMGSYKNDDLIVDVFNHIDAIVVPSIWGENSPLVIHEAQQANIPVITANYGGMKEYVHHEVNGLLFKHRDPNSLASQMQRLANDPDLAEKLGRKGYLFSEDGFIPDINLHVKKIEEIYEQARIIHKEKWSLAHYV